MLRLKLIHLLKLLSLISPLRKKMILQNWIISRVYGCYCRWAHDDVTKWKHFPRYWPFVRGIHRSPANSPHKGQWRGALMFSLICDWINGWVNNGEADDLRRHRAHCDVSVMCGDTWQIWTWYTIGCQCFGCGVKLGKYRNRKYWFGNAPNSVSASNTTYYRKTEVSKSRDWKFKSYYRSEIDRHISSIAAEESVKFQSDRAILHTNISASIFREILI